MPNHPFYVTTPIYYANARPHIDTVSSALVPAMPGKMAELRRSLNLGDPWLRTGSEASEGSPVGRVPREAPVLFPKIE